MEELEVKCANGLIPFPGYIMNFYGKILVRGEECYVGKYIKNHEYIHHLQTHDIVPNPNGERWRLVLGYTLFYIFYGIEGLIKGILSLFTLGYVRAYASVSWEQEAYNNDYDMTYRDTRQKWGSLPYLFKLITKRKWLK